MKKASLLYQFVVLQRGFFIVVPFFFRNRLWLFGYSSLFDSSDCRNTAVCWNGGQSIPHKPCRSEQSLETRNSSNLRQSVVPHPLPDEQKYTMLYRIQIFTSAPISILRDKVVHVWHFASSQSQNGCIIYFSHPSIM